ncbi:MAG: M1 family metallopeptidase, partial [Nitrososphaerota archaeon]|nr:M1 family metallopeptidase [Nitrososphaerota archaeon]
PFEFTDAVDVDGVPLRVVYPVGKGHLTALALEAGAFALRFFGEYFAIPYPGEKLDMVAIPDFAFGAMENLGAVTFRESALLIDAQASSQPERERIVDIVSHEIAHMWFGDLVTMKWWDDLWLNESFATFMGYKMTGRLRPEWNMQSVFLRDETFAALNLDAVRTTHPIQAHVKKVEDVMHNFDAISYNKGGSILRMLESYVGEDVFRQGVSNYLKKFSYSNASGADLWRSLGAASRLPVSDVAKQWLTRPGFPVVKATAKGRKLTLTQKRFMVTGSAPAAPWPIPTNVRSGDKTRPVFFDEKSTTVDIEDGSEVLVNVGRSAFHVTMYDQKGYDALARNFATLSPEDRAGLVNDLYLFLQSGEVDRDLYLKFIRLCGKTPDSLTVETAASQLFVLRTIAWDSEKLKAVYPEFFPPLLEKIGEDPRPGEPVYIGAAREDLTSQYVELDDAYAAKLAPRFEHYADVNPDLKGAVAVAYARVHGEKAMKPLVEMVKSLQGEVDRAKIWGALCSFPEPGLVEEALELGLSGEVSRSDSAYPMMYGATNTRTRDVYWRWLTKNYDGIYDMYAGSQQFFLYIGRLLPLTGVAREAEVKRFLSGRRMKQGGSSLTRAMEHLAINSKLRSRLLAK